MHGTDRLVLAIDDEPVQFTRVKPGESLLHPSIAAE